MRVSVTDDIAAALLCVCLHALFPFPIRKLMRMDQQDPMFPKREDPLGGKVIVIIIISLYDHISGKALCIIFNISAVEKCIRISVLQLQVIEEIISSVRIAYDDYFHFITIFA